MRTTLFDPAPADPMPADAEPPTAPAATAEAVPAPREEFLVSVFAWD